MVTWHEIWISLITCNLTPFYPIEIGFLPGIIEFYAENYYCFFFPEFFFRMRNLDTVYDATMAVTWNEIDPNK